MEVINFRFILADTGSWMNNTYCIEPYMSLYIDVGRVWELSFAKQLSFSFSLETYIFRSIDWRFRNYIHLMNIVLYP